MKEGMIARSVPAVAWLRNYRRSDLGGDVTAGFTVAVMLIPQGMAYAMLAGLPPVIGLYASTVPLIVYALFGTSRQLAVGPVAIVSLLTFTGISALAEPGSGRFVALAAMLALMTGVIQWVLGVLRGGFVVNFLSHAVISGFTSAAAIVIGVSQLRQLLGVDLRSGGWTPGIVYEAATRLGEANPYTLGVGLLSTVGLLLGSRLSRRLPIALLVVALATIATWLLGLHERGVRIVGAVPQGLPAPSLPLLDAQAAGLLLVTAVTISFVGFMESFAVGKSLARREKYGIEANQELKALGLANVAAGFFSGFPVTGGFSRSAVNYQAGARTGLASLLTALLILLTLLAFTSLFFYLPTAALAAIILVAVYRLIDVGEAVHLFRLKPADGWTLVVTFATTLLVGIEAGILVGVGFSLLVFIWRSAYPHSARLGYLERERVFRNVSRYPEVVTYPGTLILRVDASLYFANTQFLENTLRRALVEQPDLRHLVLDFAGVNDMDAMALDSLEELIGELEVKGVGVWIAAMKGPVRDVTARAGWPEKFGRRTRHYSVESALREAGVWEETPGGANLSRPESRPRSAAEAGSQSASPGWMEAKPEEIDP
jgi:sulfate permease, SulP family